MSELPQNLEEYLIVQKEWSSRTFGQGPRPGGITKHIEKELEEIRRNPDDLLEWIDVVILALDGFWRQGGRPEEAFKMMVHKQVINLQRVYPMPANPNELSEHVRTPEEQAQKDLAVNDFRMDELDAVMYSVDKWFEQNDPRLQNNPATRAADAREIALQAIERVQLKERTILANAKRLLPKRTPNWVAYKEIFGTGATTARARCTALGLDPDGDQTK